MSTEKPLQEAQELRPCPFCGSGGRRLLVDADFVMCVECGATGPESDRRGRGYVPAAASTEAWNRRRSP